MRTFSPGRRKRNAQQAVQVPGGFGPTGEVGGRGVHRSPVLHDQNVKAPIADNDVIRTPSVPATVQSIRGRAPERPVKSVMPGGIQPPFDDRSLQIGF